MAWPGPKLALWIIPTRFEYFVGNNKVAAEIRWEYDNCIGLKVSNHSRQPSFYKSTYYVNSWDVTDGIVAMGSLTDHEHQYAMLGFAGEIKAYLIFDGDKVKVAFSQ